MARVVVDVAPPHLDRLFDYAIPDDLAGQVRFGQRVMVPFAGRSLRGLVVEVADTTDVAPSRLRPLKRLLGDHAWVTAEELDLFRWAARRQGSPLADVVRHALPDRVVAVERSGQRAGWWPPADAEPRRPGVEATVPEAWRRYEGADRVFSAAGAATFHASHWTPLASEDVGARLAELATAVVDSGRQVLVVTPDSASRVAATIVAAFDDEVVADVRGDTSKRVTYRAWLRARSGQPDLVIGERGVAFWPMPRLGLAVLLDEANPAAKERRSPRHHAREVLLERARRDSSACLLVGQVASATAWRLHRAARIDLVHASRADERAAAPLVRLGREAPEQRARLSRASIRVIRDATASGRHAVVLASRRGEGRAMVCTACGARSVCPRCRAGLAHSPDAMTCDGCGWRRPGRPRCTACRGDRFSPLAAGAGRLAAELRRTVEVPVAVLEGYAPDAPPPPAVLVCTRGAILDEPVGPVGAVVLADIDALLRRPALDAAEDTLRLCMRAASWVAVDNEGRDPGRPVVVETDEPSHPVVQALQRWDPRGFWEQEEQVRMPLRFPPCADAIRLDGPAEGDIDWVGQLGPALGDDVDVLGPLPMDGRLAVLLKTDDRVRTVDIVAALRRTWSEAGLDVRLDVDPVDVA